jgi:spore coat polysaccharide biosynthesis protein SpsF (cytidylyltransferase family)
MVYNCLLTVRTASTRLKNKCLLPFGNYNFLEHSIKRCLAFNLHPIVCTTNLKIDDVICNIAKKYSVEFYRGSVNNKIKRWYDCANYFHLNNFHTIDVDDPFFDPKSIKKSLDFLKKYDVVLPSKKSRGGGGSEGYS